MTNSNDKTNAGKTPAGQAQADQEAQRAQEAAARAQADAEAKAREAERVKQEQEEAERLAKESAQAAAAAKKAAETTTTLEMVDVVVVRDPRTQIPDRVYAHEVPILEALYPEMVAIKGREPVEVVGFNPATELERLARKYKTQDPGDSVVSRIYRNPVELAREAGVSYSGTAAAKPARSVQTKPKKKVIGRKS